jgi:protein-ribulosamine 3-kinase
MEAICQAISDATGTNQYYVKESSLSGGCINEAKKLETTAGTWFVKLNTVDFADIFSAEADALDELEGTNTIRVPKPITHGISRDKAFLVLEFIHLQSAKSGSQARAGEQLAKMHQTSAKQFGWKQNNVIGATLQINKWSDSWIDFYREQRLQYQFELAGRNGRTFAGMDVLLDGIDSFFQDYQPRPSLLHGDLWGGNISFDSKGNPVIFDPATYYGDRETDIAFTEMFGGFSPDFYRAYDHTWPLDSGFAIRKELYNLYHYLNHFNLFGGGYATTAQSIITRLIAHL